MACFPFCCCFDSYVCSSESNHVPSGRVSNPRTGIPVVPRPPVWEGHDLAKYGGSLSQRLARRLRRHLHKNSKVPLSKVLLSWAQPKAGLGSSPKRIDAFQAKQLEYLNMFKKYATDGDWGQIHLRHFDWWMFPIDDGSKAEFNVDSEDDIETLRDLPGWRDGFCEAVRLVAAAWGWDVESSRRIVPAAPGMGYSSRKDVRLAKICRSLYLFEEAQLLASMQAFAREVYFVEKGRRSFYFKGILLDELLYLQLPRRDRPAGRARFVSAETDVTLTYPEHEETTIDQWDRQASF